MAASCSMKMPWRTIPQPEVVGVVEANGLDHGFIGRPGPAVGVDAAHPPPTRSMGVESNVVYAGTLNPIP